ncbi:MAG: response regulator [Anaeroplasmataceae bacterium]
MNILIVDDKKMVLNSMIEEVMDVFNDSTIYAKQSAEKAVELIEELDAQNERLEYAFLDIELGKMNGLSLAGILKKYFPKIKLFFCTAYSQYAIDAFGLCAKGYLLKPVTAKQIRRVLDEMVTDWMDAPSDLSKDIRIQTFGDFEVFVDGKILKFERQKAKELLAYLVDRHGASVTTERIAAILWENENYDRKLKNKTTATISSLKKTLENAGISDILVKSWNHLSIDTSKIKCDAYDYEKMDAIAINSFRGEYMMAYSWAIFSTGIYDEIKEKYQKKEEK